MSIEDFPARPRHSREYELRLRAPPSLSQQLGIGAVILGTVILVILVLILVAPVANGVLKSTFEDLYRQGKGEFTYNRLPA